MKRTTKVGFIHSRDIIRELEGALHSGLPEDGDLHTQGTLCKYCMDSLQLLYLMKIYRTLKKE